MRELLLGFPASKPSATPPDHSISLAKDWRTLKNIADTNFPLVAYIFSTFEATPKNLVLRLC